MSSRPKLTQPLRPAARYRKGQAPANLPVSDSDDDDQQADPESHPDEAISDNDEPQAVGAGRGRGVGGQMKVSLREVEVDQRGQVRVGGRTEVGRTVEETSEEDSQEEDQPPRARVGLAGVKVPGASGTGADEVSLANLLTHTSINPQLTFARLGSDRTHRVSTKLIRRRRKLLNQFTSHCLFQSKQTTPPRLNSASPVSTTPPADPAIPCSPSQAEPRHNRGARQAARPRSDRGTPRGRGRTAQEGSPRPRGRVNRARARSQ